MINDFLDLIFPRLCCACNHPLLKVENIICTNCVVTLPKTNFHLDKDNPISKLFWGRVPVEMATSFYVFNKKGRVQNLLHCLKYKGVKEVGMVVGQQFGNNLKQAGIFKGIDFIVPVPLHKNKLKKRGYNQSEWIARGISEAMGIPINLSSLFRAIDSETQTKKSRYKRWENVGNVFCVSGNELKNKRVLLVDDVVTTGATIEACTQVLLQEGCKVFVATIAHA